MTAFSWKLTFSLCWWIRLDIEGLDEYRKEYTRSGRPCVMLCNHTSFLDTIVSGAFMPLGRRHCNPKMLAARFIFKIPMLRDFAKGMGHLEVPFVKQHTTEDDMSVDDDVMARRMAQLEEHLQIGGAAVWFPEGRMNLVDSHTVQKFRAGAFKALLRVDTEIWCTAFLGNNVCWPARSSVGGRPCHIRCKIFKLTDSSFSLVKDSLHRGGTTRNGDSANGDPDSPREQTVYLADYVQRSVQSALDELVEKENAGRYAKNGIAQWSPLPHLRTSMSLIGFMDIARMIWGFLASPRS